MGPVRIGVTDFTMISGAACIMLYYRLHEKQITVNYKVKSYNALISWHYGQVSSLLESHVKLEKHLA